ncbi:MAG: FAD-binding protein [Betaproteobacteria bacterium]|nr:FAD-binding protein [Betaproteobacteria bacterium]
MLDIDWEKAEASISGEVLSAAVEALQDVLGVEHVKSLPGDVDVLSRSTLPQSRRPSAVVYPSTAEEVAAVVGIARRYGIPLWPCSRGRNWGYGSATPVVGGSVVVVLERMDRILEVNDELAYAVVEPGVTYRQLRNHLEAKHPELWCDCTDGTPQGSVIGNALDRGLGTTHYADHFATLCGLEVVLPTGEIVRTGGGVPGCKTWHTHKWGVGPYAEGLFSQSSLGIVVKAGVWLMPRPEAFVSFTFDLARPETLPELVDIIRDLALTGVVTSAVHLINDVVSLAVMSQYTPDQLRRFSRLPEEELAPMRAHFGIARWSFGGGLQGRRAFVRAAKRELRRRLAPLGRLVFVDDRTIGLVRRLLVWRQNPLWRGPVDWAVRAASGKSPEMLAAAPEIHDVLKGVPSDYFVRHAYFKSPLPKPRDAHPDRDGCGLIWFAPIVPMTGSHVRFMVDLCEAEFKAFDFDFYVALLIQNPRSMIVLTAIFFLKDDPVQCDRAAALYGSLSRKTADAGYQSYRVSTAGMTTLSEKNPEFFEMMSRIRRAIDPDGVLAPGKYGFR